MIEYALPIKRALFLITRKEIFVAGSLKELQKKSKGKSGAIQHMKGLGEVNVGILRYIAFNSDTRTLVQLTHSRVMLISGV